MKKFNIQTLGCQMNERDSETIAGMLIELGYESCDDKKDADVAIINTCSVRDNADQRFYGMLGQFKKKKEQNPEFIVAICGCMMQQQHVIDTVKEKFPWVDIIFGTHNISSFPRLLENVINEKKKQVEVWEDGGEIVEGLPHKRLYKHKSFVNIMFGCNNFCTYCIVPYTRGRERSRKPEDILAEVKRLVDDGVVEVTLLGQNVNSYKGEGGVDFADLIRMLNDVEGLERIRFMTSHPKDLSDKLIDTYRDCEKLCSYFHLPVQSGNNNILKRMNRRYTREDYLELIRKLREVREDIAISTDIIVGFPGETEEEFLDTLELAKEVCYDSAFTFLYSIRKGTPAEKYGDQIPEDVKHDRFNRLVEAVNEGSEKQNKKFVGKVVEVLVEGESKTNKENVTGRSSQNKIVNFPGDESMIGKIVKVKITEANTFSLVGEMVQ
ncbi:MAG: tRNA (N6-isopentenyl adenosine(37)-C2)-methylthiotransferase MiaB [Eubacterium sp.]|nr:tRNA (N6-isopentenyl adenosine(37)-C2)-methylthiotransferase MiaB [Eubacterium sp.]